jgi:hypothetical protein
VLLQPRGEQDVQKAHRCQVKHAGRITRKVPNSGLGSVLGHYGHRQCRTSPEILNTVRASGTDTRRDVCPMFLKGVVRPDLRPPA